MSTARIWVTERRKQLAIALALLIAFVLALALWAGRSDDGTALPAPPSTSSTPVDPSGLAALPPAAAPPSQSSSSGTLPSLPGLPNLQLPDTTKLVSLGPGKHRIVLTATSDKPLLAVSYSVKGDASGKVIYNVKSPVVIGRTVSGARPYAIIALQVGPTGTTGSCKITIDGKVVDTRTIDAAYAVMQCVG